VPAPGRPLWQAATASLLPNPATKVNPRNSARAPLLLIAGSADHAIPPSLTRVNARHYRKSPAITDYQEFAGRPHLTLVIPGWEEIADYALGWAARRAAENGRPVKTSD